MEDDSAQASDSTSGETRKEIADNDTLRGKMNLAFNAEVKYEREHDDCKGVAGDEED